MRANSLRRWTAGAAALLLAAATMMSMTGSVLAAVPTADATSAAVPARYSAGNAAGFRGTFLFTDSSTLAKLFLTLTTTGADANVHFTATKNGANAARFCTVGTVTTTCEFKSVRQNDLFVITSAYSTSAPSVTANFEWGTTGSTGSDGGNTSHGDTWDDTIQTATLSADANYAGGFMTANGSGIGNLQSVSASNRQATKLANLPAGIAATVLDGDGLDIECRSSANVNCGALIGEWSTVEVADGNELAQAFQIVITFYAGAPKGFVHVYGPKTELHPDGELQEFVPPCAKRAPVLPCFTWSAKNSQATITTLYNGSWRGL